jgi:DNA-binding NarL/FixJ family response regulator
MRLPPSPPAPPEHELYVLVASGRGVLHDFFQGLPSLRVLPVELAVSALDLDADALEEVTVAVVDVAMDLVAALEFCRELEARRPGLPIAGLVCCPQALSPWQLQSLLALGLTSLFDLSATSAEAARTIESTARGSPVFQLHLQRGERRLLREILSAHEPSSEAKVQLLQLVARGLPDHEIGRRLHLSPHTVKHHIEDLRDGLGARNRIELAAWAGRHGLYAPDGERPTARRRVPLTHPRP